MEHIWKVEEEIDKGSGCCSAGCMSLGDGHNDSYKRIIGLVYI